MIKDSPKIRHALIYHNGTLAGHLLKNSKHYVFLYDKKYRESKHPSIALNMPKKKRLFSSPYMFAYFQGLLPEGENKTFYCKQANISPTDKFSMLAELAQHETIGAITVKEIK